MKKSILLIFVSLCLFTDIIVGEDNKDSEQYLFAWLHDPIKDDPAFLATLDVLPSFPTYGKVLGSIQGEGRGKDAHHTNHFLPACYILFANDFKGGFTHIFDLKNDLTPKHVASFSNQADFTFPNSLRHTIAVYLE